MKAHKLLFICALCLCVTKTNTSFAGVTSGGKCNTNDHCKVGWFCVNGIANNDDYNLNGVCQPNIVAKQQCTLHKAITLTFGKFVVLFGAILIGWSFLQGKIEIKNIITMILGTMLIFAPFLIINILTRIPDSSCDFRMVLSDKFLYL
ncbi:MAG: hypothetical protein JJW01_00390 [Alphaproteobacteria bacterium]|nr:hypothetical protein [Rickettsiales bacterium]